MRWGRSEGTNAGKNQEEMYEKKKFLEPVCCLISGCREKAGEPMFSLTLINSIDCPETLWVSQSLNFWLAANYQVITKSSPHRVTPSSPLAHLLLFSLTILPFLLLSFIRVARLLTPVSCSLSSSPASHSLILTEHHKGPWCCFEGQFNSFP